MAMPNRPADPLSEFVQVTVLRQAPLRFDVQVGQPLDVADGQPLPLDNRVREPVNAGEPVRLSEDSNAVRTVRWRIEAVPADCNLIASEGAVYSTA
jgi:hypothetical protein